MEAVSDIDDLNAAPSEDRIVSGRCACALARRLMRLRIYRTSAGFSAGYLASVPAARMMGRQQDDLAERTYRTDH